MICVSLFPLLPKGIESVLLISTSLISIIYFIFQGNFYWNSHTAKTFFTLSSLFFIALFTLFYSENITYGFTMIVRLLPILIFPMVFLINHNSLLNGKKTEIIKFSYIGALFVSLIIIHIIILNDPNIDTIGYFEKRILFERISKVHGTYFSLWIGFGIILIAFFIQELFFTRIKIAVLLFLIGIYFFYWLFFIGARMPLISTILILLIYLIYKNNKWFVLSLFIGLIGLFFISKKEGASERLKNLSNYNFSLPKGQYASNYRNISADQIRNGIFLCSYYTIKQAPLLGYGIGDADDKLQECYDKNFTDTDTYKVIHYNSHNEYIFVILISGLIGFFVFSFSFFKLIIKALRSRNLIYLSFLCYILMNFCFENILSRHDGVLFFSFFNSILFFQLSNKK
jgi:O-antigen ligase